MDCGNCDLVARTLGVMNALLMQFVITRAISRCLNTQRLLVRCRHMMNEPTRQEVLLILWEKIKKTARLQLIFQLDCGINMDTALHFCPVSAAVYVVWITRLKENVIFPLNRSAHASL